MQAASRESYAAAQERLDGYADQASSAELAALADEVLAVAGLLTGQPRLRRALSDPAREGADRAGLLGGLLEGKVAAQTLDLLRALVSGRWSAPSELLEATERLGVDALLASAARAGQAPKASGVGGQAGSAARAGQAPKASGEGGQAGSAARAGQAPQASGSTPHGELGEVEDELFRFGQIVIGDPRLAAALGDASAGVSRRVELVRSLLAERARPVTVRLAEIAVAGFGGRGFTSSLTRLVELAAERRDRHIAYVTVAEPLTEADEHRLGARLAEMYGREVSLKITVDPGVLGGVRVRVGNDLYDGTIARRLAENRNALAGTR
ncbi:MAG TPA: F0F1 ATP synthase subunit delta [Micromonosporaceae bacterium]|nr:F0F1 ATP synthase subunit delta [Micromonosporaceae bacterium]